MDSMFERRGTHRLTNCRERKRSAGGPSLLAKCRRMPGAAFYASAVLCAVLASGCASTADPLVMKSVVEHNHDFAAGRSFLVQGPLLMYGKRQSTTGGVRDSSDEAREQNLQFGNLITAALEARGLHVSQAPEADYRVEFNWTGRFHRSRVRLGGNTDGDFGSTATMGIRIYSLREKRWVWRSEGHFELARRLDPAAQELIVRQLFDPFPLPARAAPGPQPQPSP